MNPNSIIDSLRKRLGSGGFIPAGFRRDLEQGLASVSEDMLENPTRYAGFAGLSAPRAGMADDFFVATRRAVEGMSPAQLTERSVTNFPRPSNVLSAKIDQVKAAIGLNKTLGNTEEVSRLARQLGDLLRQKAAL